jgi:uncharacterized membrane protein YkgB
MLTAEKIQQTGIGVMRYSVVLILFWFGLSKFTPTEAGHIVDLVKNNPFMAWLYKVLSVQGTSNVIGLVEVAAALLLAARPFSARLSLWGSLLGMLAFICTVSFIFTTPGSFEVMDGLLVLAGAAGFIIKDLVMLGFCIWAAGEAWQAISQKNNKLTEKSLSTPGKQPLKI